MESVDQRRDSNGIYKTNVASWAITDARVQWKLHSKMPTNQTILKRARARTWNKPKDKLLRIRDEEAHRRYTNVMCFIGFLSLSFEGDRARDFNSLLNGIKPIRLDNYILLIFLIRFEEFFIWFGILHTVFDGHWLESLQTFVVFFFSNSKSQDFSHLKYITLRNESHNFVYKININYREKKDVICLFLLVVSLVFVKRHSNPGNCVSIPCWAFEIVVIYLIVDRNLVDKRWLDAKIMSMNQNCELKNQSWKLSVNLRFLL